MSFLKGKIITYIVLGVVLASFICLLVMTTISVTLNFNVDAQSVIVDGKYSVDGGKWTKTIPHKMANENFTNLVVKGKLSKSVRDNRTIIIAANDVWFELKADGKNVASNYRPNDKVYKNTPGYSVCYVSGEKINEKSDVELRINYPYSNFSSKNLVDYYDMYVGDEATVYELLFQHKVGTIFFCMLVCFFGLFAFPIAGIVLGGIDYKYLTFSILCFFAGLFMLSRALYSYIPIWVDNPVLCLSICSALNHLFAISALVYIKVCLTKERYKLIGNVLISVFTGVILLVFALNYTGIYDFYATKPLVYIFFGLFAVIMTVMFVLETRDDIKRIAQLISWLPMIITAIYDMLNLFFGFTSFKLLQMGTGLMLFMQLGQLIFDLRKQYKETIRYQKIQNELYEARVSIMVSQIQPHFLYNSLTSIAMMCTKDPKVAKNATINFADYLRGNMNSLKEKNPVAFSRELEHLKKYIMLEQLRFGDMLDIEYDIEASDFVLPQLSVQPLVENAIKHGVGMKEDGGTVKISTREYDDRFEVVVSDDGVGFDTEKPLNDSREHVGMNNVKQRLKEMCNAKLIIESEIGKGTVAKIILPKEEKE